MLIFGIFLLTSLLKPTVIGFLQRYFQAVTVTHKLQDLSMCRMQVYCCTVNCCMLAHQDSICKIASRKYVAEHQSILNKRHCCYSYDIVFKIFCFRDENLLKATIFNAIKTLIMSHFPNDGKLNFEETDFEIFIYLESVALLSFLTSHCSYASSK